MTVHESEIVKRLPKIIGRQNSYLVNCVLAVFVLLSAEAWAETKLGGEVVIEELPLINAIEVDASNPNRLYVATKDGLYLATPHATAVYISGNIENLGGFSVDPVDRSSFLASAKSSEGNTQRIMKSNDGGKYWSQLGNNLRDNIKIQRLEVSKADPNVIYGVGEGILLSRDGGVTWAHRGKIPGRVYDIATSETSPDMIYLATEKGLLKSVDAGQSWRPAGSLKGTATMVSSVKGGPVYSYIKGAGLVKGLEPSLAWMDVTKKFTKHPVRKFTVDPNDLKKMYVVDDMNRIFVSDDAGNNWKRYGS